MVPKNDGLQFWWCSTKLSIKAVSSMSNVSNVLTKQSYPTSTPHFVLMPDIILEFFSTMSEINFEIVFLISMELPFHETKFFQSLFYSRKYLIKINIRDCFFRKEFYPFCKVLSVTKVYRLPIDSLLICKHLR